MGRLFGTDGIRGIANRGLDASLAFRVGQAVALVLSQGRGGRPKVALGKDTRISSDMLEAALVAGLCASGADVIVLGVIPTPAVAYITVESGADAGIVISASHNPYEHNGIKIFNGRGFKLSDELEQEIEDLVLGVKPLETKSGGEIGRVLENNGFELAKYVEHLQKQAEGEIRGIKVIIDCANGAASTTAARLFRHFPISLEFIKDSPNGVNINDGCGSTHMEALCQNVVVGGYDVGIAFDGDADRCLVVDEKGNVVDGDKIMGIVGRAMMQQGKLKKNTIVATVMSNLGFHHFAKQEHMQLLCAAVGDRNVLEMMQQGGYNLGGEQSGHIIFLDDSTTGDGQLAAVKFLSVLCQSGKTVSQLAAEIPQYPQVLLNVPVDGGNTAKEQIMASQALQEAISEQEKILGEDGRILVRPSGTEALIRVMVEAGTLDVAQGCAGTLAEKIQNLI